MAQMQIFDLLAPIGQVCRGCNTTTMTDAYIRAARRLCNESRWFRSTLPGATVEDQSQYSLGSDTYHEITGVSAVSLTVSSTETRMLVPNKSDRWNPDEDPDTPSEYAYIAHAQLALWPTPDAAYDLSIGLVLQPKINSNSIDDSLLVNWSEAFIDGALSYLLMLHGMPWTDKAEGRLRDGLFRSAINSAKSDVAAGYNAGALPAPSFGARSNAIRTGMQIL